MQSDEPVSAKPFYTSLYFQVLVAIALGVGLALVEPAWGVKMQPLGDGFIKLIKMIIAPVIFCTVVSGIAGMEDMKSVGKTGGYALLYFIVVSAVALIIGLIVVNIVQPGVGMNVDPATLDAKAVAQYEEAAKKQSIVTFLLNIIPTTVVDAFAKGEMLQVLLFSLLFGFALHKVGDYGKPVLDFIERLSHVLFGIVGIVMRVAPIGAFGAMAFTIAKYGIGSLKQLAALMICFYVTCLLFVFIVLGGIARVHGFSIWRLVKHIREELFIVLGTSSSETVLPRIMAKMEAVGCRKSVVGMVIPTGYSFNLDGTAIYLTMAAIFLAQATNYAMPISEQLALLVIMMILPCN